eukprot:8015607-Pyramimonas_sp.AAC.1
MELAAGQEALVAAELALGDFAEEQASAQGTLAITQCTLAITQGTLAITQGTLAITQGTLVITQGTLTQDVTANSRLLLLQAAKIAALEATVRELGE